MAKKGKKGSAKEKESAAAGAKGGRGKPGAKDAAAEPEKPGAESYRRNREEFTKLDRLQMALTELSTAVGRFPLIQVCCSLIRVQVFVHSVFANAARTRVGQVYERGYIVAERLNSTLETHMTYALVQLLELEPDAPFRKLARPSEYLASVQTLIDMLQSLETHGMRVYEHLDDYIDVYSTFCTRLFSLHLRLRVHVSRCVSGRVCLHYNSTVNLQKVINVYSGV